MKFCNKCRLHKEGSAFWRDSSSPDGLQRYCKSCQITYRRAWLQANRDLKADQNRRSYLRRKNRLREITSDGHAASYITETTELLAHVLACSECRAQWRVRSPYDVRRGSHSG